MEKIVLMRLMGHGNFQTTQKFYIRVSAKHKRLAMQEAYKVVFYERKASKKKNLYKKNLYKLFWYNFSILVAICIEKPNKYFCKQSDCK